MANQQWTDTAPHIKYIKKNLQIHSVGPCGGKLAIYSFITAIPRNCYKHLGIGQYIVNHFTKTTTCIVHPPYPYTDSQEPYPNPSPHPSHNSKKHPSKSIHLQEQVTCHTTQTLNPSSNSFPRNTPILLSWRWIHPNPERGQETQSTHQTHTKHLCWH